MARGHRITVFNRGVSQADLPAGVVFLQGDRSIEKLNLDALRGKKWDAAIDNSQTDPAWVTKTADLLKNAVTHYLYVSSTGVYLPYLTPNIREDIKPVLVDPDGGTSSYGVRKALSELENTKVFGDRAINVRPNFIVGPGDPTPRFNYWPARHARGGEILVPGNHDDHVQFADVRDLTAFMIHLIETGRTGTFNIAGDDRMTMERFQTSLMAAIPRQQTLTWIADLDFLRANRLTAAVPWIPTRRNRKGEPYRRAITHQFGQGRGSGPDLSPRHERRFVTFSPGIRATIGRKQEGDGVPDLRLGKRARFSRPGTPAADRLFRLALPAARQFTAAPPLLCRRPAALENDVVARWLGVERAVSR
jgi:nucleoside-diphosphate-sugar epimerase